MSWCSADSWLLLRFKTRCIRSSCISSGAAPRSFLALASGCTVPLRVTSWLSSMGLTIRAAGAISWDIAAVPHSNVPDRTQRGNERRRRIVVFLNPFWGGESPGTRNVAVSNGKNTVEQPTRRLYTECILADNSNEIGSPRASPHGSAISSARKIEAWRRKSALWNT